jgi:voltage-gated potassium channel
VALILAVAVVLWFDRDGLRDNAHPARPLGVVDVFYFTVVSLTTVGYGDVAPVTDGARLVNAVLLTPIRVFLWALFLGTAYELTLLRLRLREERRMKDLRERLADHVVVCGYGVKGRAIVAELRAHGHAPGNARRTGGRRPPPSRSLMPRPAPRPRGTRRRSPAPPGPGAAP